MISAMITLFLHFTYWHEKRYNCEITGTMHRNSIFTSRYVWWVVLFPAIILLIVAAWQLWSQYYQLSTTSRFVILALYSLLMAFILSDIGTV